MDNNNNNILFERFRGNMQFLYIPSKKQIITSFEEYFSNFMYENLF